MPEKLKQQHKTGINTIFKICAKKYKDKTVIASLILALFFTIACYFSFTNLSQLLEFFKHLLDRGFLILPNLIGYSIAGLAIILGAFMASPQKRLFEQINENKPLTRFQFIIANFSFIIMIFAGILFIWLLLDGLIAIQAYRLLFTLPNYIALVIGYLILFITFFISFYTVFCLFDLVSQIFTCSQIFHYLTITNKEQENAKKQ